MYTSGSTGQPKGVVIEHGQLANYAAAVSQELGLARCQRFAIVSTMAADLGHTALYGGLFNGGCLVIASDEDMSDGQSFARFLREGEVDCLKIVPSHLEALLVSETRQLPRTLVLGGESTPLDLVARILAIEPGCSLFNHYGPTETTVGVMVHPVRSLEEERSHTQTGTLPLTRVLPGCRVYLLDAAQRLVPTGQLGELYVGGAQVCRGYVNGGQEQRFVPDPLRPGERLYRTGDLGRYRVHGGIDLMGRADDQVKISGYRIEPGEVEAVLRALPGVLAGAVLVQQTTTGPRLVAYVAVDDPESPTGEQRLLDGLRQSLPDPMVPREVVLLAQLPRLPNGKLDRQSLPRAVRSSATAARPAGEASDLEAGILSCMARVLAREDLGVLDSFFDFGGNSLLAIKLVSRLRERFHIEVPLNAVFDHPSAEQLALVLEQLGGNAE
jgi:acyl-coenzyme A synthetase/AMP-(fatty) acid ligase/acyl carrier protein